MRAFRSLTIGRHPLRRLWYSGLVATGLALSAPLALAWPDLRLAKSGPTQAEPGQIITYTLSYSNMGPVKSTSVVLKDFLPPNTTVISGSLNGGSVSGSTISWSIGTLSSKAKGSRSFQVRVGSNLTAGMTITNNAQIFGKEAEEPGDSKDNYAKWITTIVGGNRAPVAQPDAYSVAEDAPLNISSPGVLANDTDADGNTLTAVLVSGTTHGTLTLRTNGSFTYVPFTNYFGPDSFTYRASDGTTNSGIATVSLTVTPVNDAPVALPDSYSVAEDSGLSISPPGVLANDSDVDGDLLSAQLVVGPAHGTVTLNADGSFNYVPGTNYFGPDSFSYRATDGSTNSAVVLVNLNVTPVNDAPVAQPDSYSVAEEGGLTIGGAGVLANDSDVEGDALAAVLVAGPAHGTLTLNSDGSFTYVPETNYFGADSFTYRANDGTTDSDIVVVTLNVTPVNDAPVALADTYQVAEDERLVVSVPGVLSNDSDVDGDPLLAELLTGPAHGTLVLNADGSFSYLPATNYFGSDSFTYRAVDGSTNSDPVQVTITVAPVNDPPEAGADAFTINEDESLNVAIPGVLANDSDIEGDALSAVLVIGPAQGTLTLNADGSFRYLPATNYAGIDSFSYRAHDGVADSVIATVTLTVTPVNDTPVAQPDTYQIAEDQNLIISAPGVLSNDSDVDGDPLLAELLTGPAHGTLVLNADGSFSYLPATNYFGSDSFTYRAVDGSTNSNPVQVTIVVTPVNDAPMAQADSYSINEDELLIVAAPGVLTNDSDLEGDALTAVLVTGPAHGTLTLNANGSFNYLPATNYAGLDSFTYRAHDGSADSEVVTVALNVAALNDAPVALDDTFSTPKNAPLQIVAPGVLANDSDPDGDALVSVLVASPSHGQLSLSTNGNFVYTPASNYVGGDLFTYRASDGLTTSGIASVMISVFATNTPPNTNGWNGDQFTALEDTTLTIVAPGVLAGVVDWDGDALSAVVINGPTNGALTLRTDGSFDYLANTNYFGPDSFQFFITDGNASSAALTATINVLPVNDPPSFVQGGNLRIQQNSATQIVTNWATQISPGPSNESVQTVAFEVANNNPGLFVIAPLIDATGTLTYTPAANTNGTAVVTVVARDNGGTTNGGTDASTPQTFAITINAPPTVQIVSPTNGASFFVPGAFTVLAEAQDSDGTVTQVDFFSATNHIGTSTNAPFFVVRTNLPVGSYTFSAVVTDDFGATNSSLPVTVNVIERPPLTFLTSVYYNPQTDYFEQRVRITNPTYSTLNAVRVLVNNLTNVPAITLRNASGKTNGVPYVETYAPVPPGSYVDMVIEFLSPLRVKPNPVLVAQLVSAPGNPAPRQGTFQPINRGLLLANRTFFIEFATRPNRVYSIQYSDDLQNWKNAQPEIRGNGNWVQWIDNGLPKTEGPPADARARFYRLIQLP